MSSARSRLPLTRSTSPDRLDPGADDRRLPAGGTRQAWAALKDGEIAGFAIIIVQPGYLLPDNVAVLPAAQGRGIGARLLALAEDHARELGLSEIRLYTNEATTRTSPTTPGTGTPRPTGPSKTD